MPSSPTPARRRRSSSAGAPRTMIARWPRSSACCKASRRVPRPWKGRPMASHDDLDLIRLFGLSAEEAGGLGLAPSAQREAEDGRRKTEDGRQRAASVSHLPPPASPPEAPDSGDAERFIWPADQLADEDDTVDVVSLFALTAEEATGLGLPPGAVPEAPGAPPRARGVPAPQTAATLPTMHLHALDPAAGGSQSLHPDRRAEGVLHTPL